MTRMTRFAWVAATTGLMTAGLGCTMIDDQGEEEGATHLSGIVSKGPVAGAEVNVYDLADDGARLDLAAEAVTEADGWFDLSFDALGPPVEITATGGSYRDEATGEEVALDGLELSAFVADAQDGGVAAVTALTTVAAARAAANADGGLEVAIDEANRHTAELFGLDGIDIGAEAPVDLSLPGEASGAAAAYAAVLGGLSQVVADRGEDPEAVLDLVAALAEDFASGEIDGQNAAGEALATASAISPEEALEGLETAIENYLSGPENESYYDYDDHRADACERAPHRPDC